jgi:dihydroceramide fatty acyl 2-hydroxylase
MPVRAEVMTPRVKPWVRHQSGRMFESRFLEAASRVHPSVPFFFYIPLVVGLMSWGLWRGVTTPGWAAGFVVLGWLSWQWMEYGIHRSFFHWEGSGPFTRRLHDITHGYHHKYPDDGDRLVMPLGASIPMALLIAGALWALGFPRATLPYFCGIVAGYLWYDYLHYAVHHHRPRTAWGKAARAHHMAHHFACPDRNFGISHQWVDRLLGTLKRRQT